MRSFPPYSHFLNDHVPDFTFVLARRQIVLKLPRLMLFCRDADCKSLNGPHHCQPFSAARTIFTRFFQHHHAMITWYVSMTYETMRSRMPPLCSCHVTQNCWKIANLSPRKLTQHLQASLAKLPLNGPEWHRIREGYLDKVPNTSEQLHRLLRKMISPTPSDRPSPANILKEKFLLGEEKEKIDELTRKLNEEKIENQRLLRYERTSTLHLC